MRIGKRSIASAERHVGFVDPAERERMPKEEAKLVDKLRARVQGKYSYGSVKDKLDRLLQEQEITRQNQIGMFGTEALQEKQLGPGERKGFLAAKLSQGLRPRASPLAREDRPSGAHPIPAAG